jgi:hypothetical protein
VETARSNTQATVFPREEVRKCSLETFGRDLTPDARPDGPVDGCDRRRVTARASFEAVAETHATPRDTMTRLPGK